MSQSIDGCGGDFGRDEGCRSSRDRYVFPQPPVLSLETFDLYGFCAGLPVADACVDIRLYDPAP